MGGGHADRVKQKYQETTLSQCYFITTTPIWTGLELKPDVRGERLATNPLSHGTSPVPPVSPSIHPFSILSDDRSKASSKTMPPHSAI